MIDRVQRGGDRAVVLHPQFRHTGPETLDEFLDLARSAGAEVLTVLTAPRERPDARLFVGEGKVQELAEAVAMHEAELVLVSHPLSPVQERNIEKLCQCRVLDRTTLILDIFAQRAQSHEGKLQVELAQLRHMATRLVRGWTHLERQKGGIGLRGPGETQLETDRRLLTQRISHLNARLDRVEHQRAQVRRQRQRGEAQTVALVGYTNAGKSTLFNALTQAQVDTRDMQFATLDPTVRRLAGAGSEILVADTVGFVSNLPHELVAAFRATLLETREADLLLHVIDAADPWHRERQADVMTVLEEIGAERIPLIEVFNKIDRTGAAAGVDAGDESAGQATRARISALSGAGLPELRKLVLERLQGGRLDGWIEIDAGNARLRAQLFELGAVREERLSESGNWQLRVALPRSVAERLQRQGGTAASLLHEYLHAAP